MLSLCVSVHALPGQAAIVPDATAAVDPTKIVRKNPWGQVIWEPCTFVTNLHVQKTGGTSIAQLFNSMGWKAVPEDTEYEGPNVGQFFVEVHGNQDLTDYAEFVSRMKAKWEPKGCKVISTMLLRNPVDQVVSEWNSFYKGRDYSWKWSTGPYNPAWATDLATFAKEHPENELRWLTSNVSASTHKVWSVGNPSLHLEDVGQGTYDPQASLPAAYASTPPLVANCAEAVAMADEAMAHIDLVGAMDDPAEFAAFWISLGNEAGFKVALPIKPSDLITATSAAGSDATADLEAGLSPVDRMHIEKLNSCSARISEMARQRQVAYKQAHPVSMPPKDVTALMSNPTWLNATRLLGHEAEDVARWEAARVRVLTKARNGK